MKIHKATAADVKNLYELEHEVFESINFPLSKGSFYYHVKNSMLFIAKIENKIAGYILVLTKRRTPKIYSIATSPTCRGLNIATKLIKHSLKEIKKLKFTKIVLEVRSDNKSAIKLYEKFNFKKIEELKEFYLDGCSAFLMQLEL